MNHIEQPKALERASRIDGVRRSRQTFYEMLVMALPLLVLTLRLETGTNDDGYFWSALTNQDLWSFLIDRYQGWTSRLLTEIVLTWITHYPMVWRFLNVGMTLLLVGSLERLSGGMRGMAWIALAF